MSAESKLIASILAGDVEAYAELIRQHQAKVRTICLGFLTNLSEADDAAQDTFIKAYESLASFKGDSSFGTWIVHIASNHCLDLLRTRQRHQTDSLDALVDQHGDALQALFRKTTSPKTYDRDELELLAKVFASLPEEERQVLVLRELDELAYDEIASKLQCSLDAVKGRLKRARQHLSAKCSHFLDTSSELPRP